MHRDHFGKFSKWKTTYINFERKGKTKIYPNLLQTIKCHEKNSNLIAQK